MGIIEINLSPTRSQMTGFGLIMAAFFGLLGAIFFFFTAYPTVAYVLWTIGLVVAGLYYLIPAFRRPMYLGWMYAILPLGWVVSHLLFAVIYFLIITPIGWIVRLFGRDSMQRKLHAAPTTYWVEHRTGEHPNRYFRQF